MIIHRAVLSRACAGMWPYDPVLLEQSLHPSKPYEILYSFVRMDDSRPRTVATGVEALRRATLASLGSRDVKHLEVRYTEVRPDGTHTSCSGDACEACEWMSTSEPEPGPVIGWVAVVTRSHGGNSA